ncbi:MAG TPA: exodeoxyribonuclease V subunit beta [Marinospirillum sp.]|uniref:exodeoxyribonuclease V subunit beta n=1 Tax=Marinospirillum sp. TaxID=2183934 RepID=UPI002B491400|nr:exodeoxyribonuclease V subunit beta [Marinospirillum sp.]HKM15363.1 exodeoxyribonuclease V subunit beta [Marinospirillum sp.]
MTLLIKQLDPLTFPLFGSRLIEASAGTGKTFTLALLYVRLILGTSNNQQGFQRPLTPKEILVVTFTELAAGELRDRIRARLVEAADYFKQPEKNADELLIKLREDYPKDEWKRCAWRLQMAAESMDEASVSTIHSWCNRMLVEHAFDTRGLFNRELVTDTSELLSQVVEDYWRVHFYHLKPEEAAAVTQIFDSPAALEKALYSLIQPTSQGVSFLGQPLVASDNLLNETFAAWANYQQALHNKTTETKNHWANNWLDIEAHLLALQPSLNGTTHGSAKLDKFQALLAEIADWANNEGDAAEPSKLRSFAKGNFKFKAKANISQEDPLKAFTLLKEMDTLTANQPKLSLHAAILAAAAVWVEKTFQQRMAQYAKMNFDDLLVQLEKALNPDAADDHAQHLATTLKRNYPIAMIDEFQDTDPIQYSIFDCIYKIENSAEDSGIFMIGDPKQSIYSFRGADIHTYLQVRQATKGRHYTLKKNFRSTQGVVNACNAFFEYAEQQPQAAFRYKQEGQTDNPIPFIAVEAQGRDEQLYLNQQAVNPMTLWYFSGENTTDPVGIAEFKGSAAEVAASQITQWLTAAAVGEAGFGKTGIEKALQPADIAILVRTSNEAQRMTAALNARGVASVYLSDREALLASQEAADLLHWLRACAEPTNERLVKAALGTLSLGLPLTRLAAWQEDELAWEAEMQQFNRLHFIWRRQGVLVMLQRLMAYYQLPARLLQQPTGERSLTNLLHLAEWLQQTASQLEGEQALIRHLYEHLGKEDQQLLLRLESDARRVKIITIHKSKGLEFPLVLLPFISGWREVDGRAKQVPYHQTANHQTTGRYTEVAGQKQFPKAWQAANDERIKEDLRLLYVAMTRASHALWLGVAPLKSGNAKKPQLEKSALGHVLNGGKVFKEAVDVYQALAELATHSASAITLVAAPESSNQQAPNLSKVQLEQARPAPQLDHLSNWWIASYSALQFAGQGEAIDEPTSAQEDQLLELSQATTVDEAGLNLPLRLKPQPLADPVANNTFMHLFPRGPKWGTFLHGLLEWAAQDFTAAVTDDLSRNTMLIRRCKLRNIDTFAAPLNVWMKDFLQQTWLTTGFALADLKPANLAVELEFLIEVHQVDTQALDNLVRPYTLQGAAAPLVKRNVFNGMLKGFIDLVAEKDGCYYIIDWKSNYLGASDNDYSQAAMQKAINAHRYDLQYIFYILALHRQLTARLPNYNYDQHIGGAVYVFLRGWKNPTTQGLFHDKPPKALIEKLDTLFSDATKKVEVSQ